MESHHSYLLQNYRIVYGIKRICTPGKWTMILYQHCRYMIWVDTIFLESFHNHPASFIFVFSLNLLWCHISSTWNLSIEIICLSGAVGPHTLTSLGKGSSPAGMSVNHAANIRKFLIKNSVSFCIGRRIQLPFNLVAIQIYNHHILWLHHIVFHPRWLNDKQA